MSKKSRKLTEKEAQIMEIFWNHGPQTIRELLTFYPDPKPHFNTVSTTVHILMDKGYAAHVGEKNSAYLYGANVESKDLSANSLASVVKTYFNNSYRSVVSALVEDEKISIAELREIVDMIEKNNKNQ